MNQIERGIQISTQDLVMLGLQQIAYVKPVRVEDRDLFAVHAADGTEMAVMASRDLAFVVIRRHDLEPVSVH